MKLSLKEKLLKLLFERNMSKADLLRLSNLKKSTFYNIFDEKTDENNLNLDTVKQIAKALNVSIDYLIDEEDTSYLPKNIIPVKKIKVPVLGSVACGKPIFAEEHLECYVDSINDTHSDFALWAKGDSMINARINDGDLVFVKQQEQVENGEIAVVLIDDEATLKRVFYDEKKATLTLVAENPRYAPFVYQGEELQNIKILGKAVAFQSNIK